MFANPVFLWFIAGVVLIVSEFVVPAFVICFFGVAAILVAGLLWLCPALPLAAQLLIFGATGVILLFLCRKFMPRAFQGNKNTGELDIDGDDVAGADCVCTAAITPLVSGKVDFRGSNWIAVADQDIEAGAVCTVINRQNLTLKVMKKEQ